jgi:uncharacterized coiled-coil protein SlyX
MSGLSLEGEIPVTNNRWTFDKSISYGDLLVTASLLLGGLTAYFTAEKRISQLEYRSAQLEESLKILTTDVHTELKELKKQSMETQLEVLRSAAQSKERPRGPK